ncbi:MAG: hypothetical protein RIS85_2566, partial [Pseudomonadota bacterium]
MVRMFCAAALAVAIPGAVSAAEPNKQASAASPAQTLTDEVRALKAMDTAGKPAEALAKIDAVLARAANVGGIDRSDLTDAELARADALYALDRYDEALPIVQRAEATMAASPRAGSVEHARLLDSIGSTLSGMGRNDDAASYLSRALQMAEASAGRKSIAYASALYGLGLVDYQRGQQLAALPRFQEAYETARAVSGTLSGKDVLLPADFGISYSALLGVAGDLQSAIAPAREALVWAESRLG